MASPRNLFRIGITSGVLFVLALVAKAQSVVDPTSLAKSLIDVAGKDAVVACMVILGLVSGGCLWFAWKQLSASQDQLRELLKVNSEQVKVNQDLATALMKFATKLDRAKCMAGEDKI